MAVKCRVHRIRIQAIRLLESFSHKEVIWDAKATACITRKVTEIEDRTSGRTLIQPAIFHLSVFLDHEIYYYQTC